MPTAPQYDFFKNFEDQPREIPYKKWIMLPEAEKRYHVTRTSIRRWIVEIEKLYPDETVKIKVKNVVIINSELIDRFIEAKRIKGE
jgi:hypothetical protein